MGPRARWGGSLTCESLILSFPGGCFPFPKDCAAVTGQRKDDLLRSESRDWERNGLNRYQVQTSCPLKS